MKWRWLRLILPSRGRRPTGGTSASDEAKTAEPSEAEAIGTPFSEGSTENGLVHEPLGVPHAPPRESGRPASLQAWETLADRIIREAMERGEFDNLRGAGKPLKLDNNPFAGDWELGFHLLKQNGFTLPWIELGREIETDRAALQALLERSTDALAPVRESASTAGGRRRYEEERTRHRDLYLKAAANLDRKLAQYSAEVPTWRMDQGRLPQHVAARQFDAACPPL